MAPLTEAATDRTAARSRLAGPVVVASIVVAGTVALHLRDPHDSGSWGYCPYKLLTGMDCPGCGSLRAVNDLSNGHLVAAMSSNLLFVAMVPVAVLLWAAWARRSWLGLPSPTHGPRAARATWLAAAAVAVVFTVVRNTPWGSWLHS